MGERDIPLTETIFYILLSLRSPNHGYGILQEVESMTNGRVRLGAGTLYGALKTLEEKGWIRMVSAQAGSRRKKEYEITNRGREVFREEVDRLREALANAARMEMVEE